MVSLFSLENNIGTSSPLLISLPPLLTDYFDRSFFPDRSSFNKIQDEKKKICKVAFMTGKGELQWWLWNPARKPCLEKIASILKKKPCYFLNLDLCKIQSSSETQVTNILSRIVVNHFMNLLSATGTSKKHTSCYVQKLKTL